MIRIALMNLIEAGGNALVAAIMPRPGPSAATVVNAPATAPTVTRTPTVIGAHGLALDGGNVLAFARGGIVHDPTLFRFARTTRRGSSASRPAPMARPATNSSAVFTLCRCFRGKVVDDREHCFRQELAGRGELRAFPQARVCCQHSQHFIVRYREADRVRASLRQ